MTISRNSTELVSRYVSEVGSNLPRKIRADVEAELSSLLEDAIDERLQDESAAGREAVAVDVIRAFGEPREVAARYHPPRYLIGPQLFPMFARIAIFAPFAVALLQAIGYFLGARHGGWPTWPDARDVIRFVVDFGKLVFWNLGLLVAVFAILERVMQPKPAGSGEIGKWDPSKLPKVEDRDAVSRGSMTFHIYVNFLQLLVLNFTPQWFGFIYVRPGLYMDVVPLTAFGIWLPAALLSLYWISEIVLGAIVLRQGQWNKQTRWAELGVGLLGTVCLMLIFFNFDPEAASLREFTLAFEELIRVSLGITVAASLIPVVTRAYRIMTR